MKKEEAVNIIGNKLDIESKEASVIVEKSIAGGEITDSSGFEEWINERFLPNLVFINEEGYSQMCIDALKILSKTAPTDYGSSRQRDLGQLWADMTRGYLGEYAFSLFLKKHWGITAKLGHDVGNLKDYLPMDIHQIKEPHAEYRTPRLKIGIKAIKWNGIWLDISGDQFNHSDVHVLVKVGTGRDHLFAFFKKISVFKDKILKIGQEVGSLSKEEAEKLYNDLPSFKPISAYICGFVPKKATYKELSYTGRKGRLHYTVCSWNGPINPGDLDHIKEKESVAGKVNFEGIGKFAHDKGYLFNTGSLLWKKTDWEAVNKNL
ncbi:MAG: hypothetical protein KKD90_07475 [Candidatus Omnitrophica bacterium]|nr:hypothetical protein [Candidatus Omnitrophota bacterium]